MAFLQNQFRCPPLLGLEEPKGPNGPKGPKGRPKGPVGASGELIRSLSRKSKWEFGVRGATMWI
jgi:hypothetical protein